MQNLSTNGSIKLLFKKKSEQKMIWNITEALKKIQEEKDQKCAVNLSIKIAFKIKGRMKYTQTILCDTPFKAGNQLSRKKIIVQKEEDLTISPLCILMSSLNITKIKKKDYSFAVVDPNDINKKEKQILLQKSLLANDKNWESFKQRAESIAKDLCTKIIQTNNTLSCKLGDASLNSDQLLENFKAIYIQLKKNSTIFDKFILMSHSSKKVYKISIK